MTGNLRRYTADSQQPTAIVSPNWVEQFFVCTRTECQLGRVIDNRHPLRRNSKPDSLQPAGIHYGAHHHVQSNQIYNRKTMPKNGVFKN